MIDDIVFPFNMTEFVKNKTTVLPGILEVYVKDTRFVCDIQHTKKTFKMLCFIRKRCKTILALMRQEKEQAIKRCKMRYKEEELPCLLTFHLIALR